MPSERQMWEALQPSMKRRGLDPVRVENPVGPGTPDVNFIEGWAELKHADHWPIKGGPLRLKHPPAPQQRAWLLRRWTAGGNVWLVLRVGKEWFVFPGNLPAVLWAAGSAPDRNAIEGNAALHVGSPELVAEFLKLGRTIR